MNINSLKDQRVFFTLVDASLVGSKIHLYRTVVFVFKRSVLILYFKSVYVFQGIANRINYFFLQTVKKSREKKLLLAKEKTETSTEKPYPKPQLQQKKKNTGKIPAFKFLQHLA